jgi:hypothetical protein
MQVVDPNFVINTFYKKNILSENKNIIDTCGTRCIHVKRVE